MKPSTNSCRGFIILIKITLFDVYDRRGIIEKEFKDIEKQIGNIVMAITNGFIQEEFKVKMEELKERKAYLEGKLVDMKQVTQ